MPLWQPGRVALRNSADDDKFAGRRGRAGHRAGALRWKRFASGTYGRPRVRSACLHGYAACLPVARHRHHHPQQRLPARAAVNQGAFLELDRQVLAIAADHPDGIGQSASRVERRGTLAFARPIETSRCRWPLVAGLLPATGGRSTNGRPCPGGRRGRCLPAAPECRYLGINERHPGKAQAVVPARRDQGG